MLLKALLVATFAAFAIAAPARAIKYVSHERREFTPRAWQKRDRVDRAQILPVRIGLTQSNLDKGPGLLDEV